MSISARALLGTDEDILPINSTLPIYSDDDLVTSDGTLAFLSNKFLWLRSGVVDTDTASYPLATTHSGLYEVAAAEVSGTKSVSSEDTNPRSIFFKPDGTRMFMLGDGKTVYQYDLSTAWDVTTAALFVGTKSVSSETNSPTSIFFKPDGTRMFMLGNNPNNTAYQYDLSTAWDVSTATLAAGTKPIVAVDALSDDMYFDFDGNTMFILNRFFDGSSSFGRVDQYDLSTNWDVSTGVLGDSKLIPEELVGTPDGIAFNSNGIKMFVIGGSPDGRSTVVYQYSLSTSWDISTAELIGGAESFDGLDILFNTNGSRVFAVDFVSSEVNQYDLLDYVGLPVQYNDTATDLVIYIRIA